MSNENESPEKGAGRRRGFLKTLGFGAAAAATPALAQHAVSPRADAVPARDARPRQPGIAQEGAAVEPTGGQAVIGRGQALARGAAVGTLDQHGACPQCS